MNKDGHWCPVSPVAKEWDAYGCKTIVQLAYLFGIQELLCDKDYHDSGFPRGRASVDDAYRTHLKRLPQRLADARAKQQQQRGAKQGSASASGTTLRQDEDPGFGRRGLLGHTPRREREQRRQDDNGYNGNGYDDSNNIDHSFTTPEPAARTRPTSTHDANPRRAPRDDPTPASSHTNARRPSDSRDADPDPTAAAAASPSNRLDEYLPLFSSQIAVGDRHERDREMSLALRFLQKEVPLVVARYNAQAAFSGKPALASYEQVVEEAIKGGRTRP